MAVLVALSAFNARNIIDHGKRITGLKERLRESEKTPWPERVPQLWAPLDLLGIPDDYELPQENPELERLLRESVSATLKSSEDRNNSNPRLLEFFPLNGDPRPYQRFEPIPRSERRPDYNLDLYFQKKDETEEHFSIWVGRVVPFLNQDLNNIPLPYLLRRLREASQTPTSSDSK